MLPFHLHGILGLSARAFNWWRVYFQFHPKCQSEYCEKMSVVVACVLNAQSSDPIPAIPNIFIVVEHDMPGFLHRDHL